MPITAVIECCDLLDLDLWSLLEGEKLAGKTSSKTIKIPARSPKLDKIVAWIL